MGNFTPTPSAPTPCKTSRFETPGRTFQGLWGSRLRGLFRDSFRTLPGWPEGSDILFPLQPPPPPHPDKPPRPSHPRGLDFGPFRLRLAPFGSVRLRLAPFRVLFWVRFGSFSGVLGGVGVGSVRGASVREKNITTRRAWETLCRAGPILSDVATLAQIPPSCAMPFKGGSRSPNMVRYSPGHLGSCRHIC